MHLCVPEHLPTPEVWELFVQRLVVGAAIKSIALMEGVEGVEFRGQKPEVVALRLSGLLRHHSRVQVLQLLDDIDILDDSLVRNNVFRQWTFQMVLKRG